MKRIGFQYFKESEGLLKNYDLIVTKENGDAYEGFSIAGAKPEDIAKILEIQKKYEEALQPFMKYYRKFLKARIRATLQ